MTRVFFLGIALCVQNAVAYGQEFAFSADGAGPEPEEVDGWDGDAIRIAFDGEGNQQNGVAFNSVVSGDYELLQIDFELRISNEDGAGDADGLGFAYANNDDWGDSIDDPVPTFALGEEPNLTGSVGVGFDTWSNQDQDEGRPNGTLPNSFSLHYDGERLLSLEMEEFDVEDDWLQNPTVKRVSIQIRPDGNDGVLTLIVEDTETGEVITPFDRETLPGFAPYDGRVLFRARTGGENSHHDVDNISVTHTPPGGQPTTFTLYGTAIGGGTVLQAGDADQDLDFDQLDLVQVQIAAKYLTGNPATWGEGDWNGAPGGAPGNPPPGNGLFDQIDIIAALNAGTYLTGPYAAIAPGGDVGDGQTSIVYNTTTGELSIDAPAGTDLTSVNIDSAAGIFTGEAAQNLGGSFDNDSDSNIFKATFGSSFGSLSFGNVAQTGLAEDFVLNDLTVVGSLAGGGDLGAVDLVYVPEPSTLVLSILALVGALAMRRHRRR